MGLVAAKCPSCGAAIQIPSDQDRCFCSFCGNQIIVEAAINYGRVEVEGVVQTRAADFDIQAGVLRGYHGASTDVVIPEGVKTVDSKAFSGMPITTVTYPASIESVRFDDWRNCRTLRGFYWNGPDDDWMSADGVFYSISNRELLLFPPAWPNEEFTIGYGIKKVQVANNPNLRTLHINQDGETMLELIISNCANLAEIEFPSLGMQSIDISYCPSLEQIDLPNYIERVRVTNCQNLKLINCLSGLDELTVYGCPHVGINGEGVLNLPPATFAEVSSDGAVTCVARGTLEKLMITDPKLKRVEIEEGPEHIRQLKISPGHDATVKLPASLKVIDSGSFSNCYSATFDFPNMDNAVIDDGNLSNYRSQKWRDEGRCPLCGGRLHGLLKKKRCGSCGREIVL